MNPMKSIREKCLDCCAGSSLEVKLCNIQNCPLYPFRFGSEERKQALREWLEKYKQKNGG